VRSDRRALLQPRPRRAAAADCIGALINNPACEARRTGSGDPNTTAMFPLKISRFIIYYVPLIRRSHALAMGNNCTCSSLFVNAGTLTKMET